MTHNQIAYATLLENQRHNTVVEKETERSARATLSETNRHNIAQENYWAQSNAINQSHLERMDAETNRHNIVSESTERYKASEQSRHNVVSEQLQAALQSETQRHNLQQEALTGEGLVETGRHQRVTESISSNQASSASQQAQASLMNARTNQQNAATNALNANTNRFKAESEATVNSARVDDLRNQITNRNIQSINQSFNTINNWRDTSAEIFRDTTTGVNNLVNSIKTIAPTLSALKLIK